MKFEISGKKHNKVMKEIAYSETQAFICIQVLSKDGYKDICMCEVKE